jgi:hypothetical protein
VTAVGGRPGIADAGSAALVYAVHGLQVRSELPLAARAVAADGFGGDVVDVDIRLGLAAPVPDTRPPGARLMAALRTGEGYQFVAVEDAGVTTLRIPAVCDFVLGPERGRVECRPDPGADLGVVAILVTGLVVGYLLIVDGHCVLHASAVEVDGAAVAFVGRSGIGKSTVAALCCAAGARLVSDDVVRLDVAAGVECVGGTTHIRLRSHATWALSGFGTRPATAPTADGRVAAMPPVAATARVPLATIALLYPSRDVRSVAIRPLFGGEAFVRVMAHPRVGGWADDATCRRLFAAVARVVERVDVVEVEIPWETSLAAASSGALLDLARRRR